MLKRLDRYTLRETLPVLLASAVFYTAVFLFGFFYVGSPWLAGIPLGLILKWLGYHVPGILVQVLPMAMVTAVVVPFGRLASEGAILAVAAGGIPLRRLAAPVLLLGLLMAGVALWLNESVAPWTNEQVRVLWWEEMHTHGRGLVRLKGRTIPLGGGLELYFRDYDYGKDEMVHVRIQKWEGKRATLIFADRGTYRGAEVVLSGYQLFRVDYGAIPALLKAAPSEVRPALRRVFLGALLPQKKGARLTLKTGLSRGEAIARFADPLAADTWSLSKAWRAAHDRTRPEPERREASLIFHAKLALPLANLVLVLLSLPFAVRYARTPGLSLGLSVLIAVGFYLVFLLFRALGGLSAIPPAVAVWTPDVAFAWIGWRGMRG